MTQEEKKLRNREKAKQWGRDNRARKLAYMRDYQTKNREARKAYSKQWYEENKSRVLAEQKVKYAAKRAATEAGRLAAAAARKVAATQKAKEARRQRYADNISYRLSALLRTRLSKGLRACGARRSAAVADLIGCDLACLKVYLEGLFQPGMSWDNFGYHGWHMDHVIPIASFDLLDPAQQVKCFHYTNLQPLWRSDNQSKQAKVLNCYSPSAGAWKHVSFSASAG